MRQPDRMLHRIEEDNRHTIGKAHGQGQAALARNDLPTGVSLRDLGMHRLKDLQALGWIDRLPRIIGVQAEGSAAIAEAFHSGTEKIVPISAKTIADSISVDLPRDGVRAVRAACETGGTYIKVSDDEILQAIAVLGGQGIFAGRAGPRRCPRLQILGRGGRPILSGRRSALPGD